MLCEKSTIHGSRLDCRRATASLARTLALALLLLCGACAGAPELAPLTPGDIAENGTLVLDAPRQTVLDACVLALRKQGYAIDAVGPDSGLVITVRRPAKQQSSSGARLFRAYVVEVTALPGGRVQVSAWPSVTEADVARGNRRFAAPGWDLDEERAAWAQLFEDVRGIVERASP